jgi:hypothetical protein
MSINNKDYQLKGAVIGNLSDVRATGRNAVVRAAQASLPAQAIVLTQNTKKQRTLMTPRRAIHL